MSSNTETSPIIENESEEVVTKTVSFEAEEVEKISEEVEVVESTEEVTEEAAEEVAEVEAVVEEPVVEEPVVEEAAVEEVAEAEPVVEEVVEEPVVEEPVVEEAVVEEPVVEEAVVEEAVVEEAVVEEPVVEEPVVEEPVVEAAAQQEEASSGVVALKDSPVATATALAALLGLALSGPFFAALTAGGSYYAVSQPKSTPVGKYGNYVGEFAVKLVAYLLVAYAFLQAKDEQFKITSSIGAKITELDSNDYLPKVNSAITDAAVKVSDFNEKNQLVSKANKALDALTSQAKSLDEKYKIVENVSAFAQQGADLVMEKVGGKKVKAE